MAIVPINAVATLDGTDNEKGCCNHDIEGAASKDTKHGIARIANIEWYSEPISQYLQSKVFENNQKQCDQNVGCDEKQKDSQPPQSEQTMDLWPSNWSLFLSNQSGAISCLIFVLAISSSALRFSLVRLMPPQLEIIARRPASVILFILRVFPTLEVVSRRYFSGSNTSCSSLI